MLTNPTLPFSRRSTCVLIALTFAPLTVSADPHLPAPIFPSGSFDVAQMVIRTLETETRSALQRLVELVEQQRWQEAYEEGNRLAPEYEGEPLFDLYYGRAALEVGEVDRALFALERVNLVEPRNAEARLLRAQGFLIKQNSAFARRQLTLLEGYSLSAAQTQRRLNLLAELNALEAAQRTTNTFTLAAEMQFHSNINTGTYNKEVESVFGISPLDDTSRSKAAPALALQAAYQRREQRTQQLTRTLQVGATTRLSTFDDANNAGGVFSGNWQFRDGRRFGAQLLPFINANDAGLNAVASAGKADVLGSLDADAALIVSLSENNSYRLQGAVSDLINISQGAINIVWQTASTLALADDFAPSSISISGTLAPQFMWDDHYLVQGLLSSQVTYDFNENEFFGSNQQATLINSQLTVSRAYGAMGTVNARVRAFTNLSNHDSNDYRGLELAVGYQHQW